ncbi:hypothetical protein [Desulfovibrio sp. TomC]|uniref:hypothetical protein n=1 Tax=Desulfovibrio sp. TomC TaxID=1562888 RepID=UPI0012E2D173|nr:hypothetical protein [Desulfovibrio sp. TomC]
MKCKAMITVAVATALVLVGSLHSAYATNFNATIDNIASDSGTIWIQAKDAVSGNVCYMVIPTAYLNPYLAIALTAQSAAKTVAINTDQASCAAGGWGSVLGIASITGP